jgi:[1-hydroxy-2-(trimethylamino)ethyl]phosphonate dioxygenase
MSIVNEIFEAFKKRGDTAYFGEPVSVLEHSIQTAVAAEQAGAAPSLVVAALLHDIGHLIHDQPEDVAERGINTQHEELACLWLSQCFGPEVTEPIRLHVAAKRYLCGAEPDYIRGLSPASIQSLGLQGGPLIDEEAEEFVRSPYFQRAILIRRWDDMAKVPGLATPDLQHYRALLESIARKEVA